MCSWPAKTTCGGSASEIDGTLSRVSVPAALQCQRPILVPAYTGLPLLHGAASPQKRCLRPHLRARAADQALHRLLHLDHAWRIAACSSSSKWEPCQQQGRDAEGLCPEGSAHSLSLVPACHWPSASQALRAGMAHRWSAGDDAPQ